MATSRSSRKYQDPAPTTTKMSMTTEGPPCEHVTQTSSSKNPLVYLLSEKESRTRHLLTRKHGKQKLLPQLNAPKQHQCQHIQSVKTGTLVKKTQSRTLRLQRNRHLQWQRKIFSRKAPRRQLMCLQQVLTTRTDRKNPDGFPRTRSLVSAILFSKSFSGFS